MTNEKKEGAEKAPQKESQRQDGASQGGREGAKRRTRSFRHENLKRERPQLSRDQASAKGKQPAKGGASKDARRITGKGKDPRAKLRIIPLGGLDAIGKNMTALECKGDMILDDAGLMFPDDDHPGIDLILPDYTHVLENADKLRGIIITHGHEDHTGSLPYLLKDLDRTVP